MALRLYGIGEVPPGSPHPDFPGCLWDARVGAYVCDDGYSVDGIPVTDRVYDTLPSDWGDSDIVSTSTSDGRVRTAAELLQRIPKGGYITVGAGLDPRFETLLAEKILARKIDSEKVGCRKIF